MPKICYRPKKFSPDRMAKIDKANEIIDDYKNQGYELTLRQLYYQFVSRDLIANNMREYKNLGDIINDARLAGLVDWDAIVDRTRNLRQLSRWNSPAEIVEACANQYHVDLWKGQHCRVEVWIEKDALVGVIEGVCNELDVPYFSCRGYTSQSEMWAAAMRLKQYKANHQVPIVLHLGDHDPSGVDMTRDIEDRLSEFAKSQIKVQRLALNEDQIDTYNPPPNPAKLTDSRSEGYIEKHGTESWELDALEPSVIVDLIKSAVYGFRDANVFEDREKEKADGRKLLRGVADNWEEIIKGL